MNAYRLLLRLAPRRFRETHRAEMEALFRHRLTEARSRGRTAAAMVWLYAALDILRATPTHLLQRWRRRGKTLNLLRLIKAVFTFEGAVDYALWKVERHAGVRPEISAWERRHPILAAPVLLWRFHRAGAFR